MATSGLSVSWLWGFLFLGNGEHQDRLWRIPSRMEFGACGERLKVLGFLRVAKWSLRALQY